MIGAVEAAATEKQKEDPVRESEEEFRAMFELSSVGQCQVDPITGRLVRVNRKMCEMTGYSAEELTQRTTGELTHPDHRETIAVRLQQLSRGEIPAISTKPNCCAKMARLSGTTSM